MKNEITRCLCYEHSCCHRPSVTTITTSTFIAIIKVNICVLVGTPGQQLRDFERKILLLTSN